MSFSRFPEQRRRFDGLPLFPKRPTMKSEREKTESTLQPDSSVLSSTSTTKPEGKKTESSLQPIINMLSLVSTTEPEEEKITPTMMPKPGVPKGMYLKPEDRETESPFYDALEQHSEPATPLIVPEGSKTEATPTQGMEPGVHGTSGSVLLRVSLLTYFGRSSTSFDYTQRQGGIPAS